MFVPRQEIIEDEVVDTLRLSIHADSWIEIGGTALDNHHQRVRIRFFCTGRKTGQGKQAQEQPAMHKKSFQEWRGAWRRWVMGYLTGGGARVGWASRQKGPPPWPPEGNPKCLGGG